LRTKNKTISIIATTEMLRVTGSKMLREFAEVPVWPVVTMVDAENVIRVA
jgi:hypothetical protein